MSSICLTCCHFKCRYYENNICNCDGKSCDLNKKSEKCHQSDNESLRKINPDIAFIFDSVPPEFRYLRFFNCQNICLHYDSCTLD